MRRTRAVTALMILAVLGAEGCVFGGIVGLGDNGNASGGAAVFTPSGGNPTAFTTGGSAAGGIRTGTGGARYAGGNGSEAGGLPSTGGGSTSTGGRAGELSGGTGGTANGGTATDGGACPAVVATGSPALIDDLNDGDNWILPNDGRIGVWYTGNDGTGTQTPSPVSGCDPTYTFSPTNGQACTTGSGFVVWGAAMGFTIADRGNGGNCKTCNYDVTAYHGVRFTISGTVTGLLRFQVLIADTHPIEWGGTCATSDCLDCYGVALSVTPQPRVVQVVWGDLRQEGWGTPVSLNLHEVQNLEWLIASKGQTASFENLCIDDVAFY